MLARSPQAPDGALAECDNERAGFGVIEMPRRQRCWLAIPRSGSGMRGSERLPRAEGVARPHGCGRGVAMTRVLAGGRSHSAGGLGWRLQELSKRSLLLSRQGRSADRSLTTLGWPARRPVAQVARSKSEATCARGAAADPVGDPSFLLRVRVGVRGAPPAGGRRRRALPAADRGAVRRRLQCGRREERRRAQARRGGDPMSVRGRTRQPGIESDTRRIEHSRAQRSRESESDAEVTRRTTSVGRGISNYDQATTPPPRGDEASTSDVTQRLEGARSIPCSGGEPGVLVLEKVRDWCGTRSTFSLCRRA
jgi:hypothetical protein